jgi:hypothetical protein
MSPNQQLGDYSCRRLVVLIATVRNASWENQSIGHSIVHGVSVVQQRTPSHRLAGYLILFHTVAWLYECDPYTKFPILQAIRTRPSVQETSRPDVLLLVNQWAARVSSSNRRDSLSKYCLRQDIPHHFAATGNPKHHVVSREHFFYVGILGWDNWAIFGTGQKSGSQISVCF